MIEIVRLGGNSLFSLMAEKAGKSWTEADADVTEAIDYLRYYALEARHLEQAPAWPVAGEDNTQVYAPRGVAVILPPWNFPLAILTGMLSAAIVGGNTAILKPSSQTPVIAARFCALLTETGLPRGVVTLLPGAGETLGETLGEALVRDPRIHLIAFTGSKAVGLRINQLAAKVSAQSPAPGPGAAGLCGGQSLLKPQDHRRRGRASALRRL